MYTKGAGGGRPEPSAGGKTLNTAGSTEQGLQDSRMECDPGVSGVEHGQEDSDSEQNTEATVEPSVADDSRTHMAAGGGSVRDDP